MNTVYRAIRILWEHMNTVVDSIENLSREDPSETQAEVQRVYHEMTQVVVDGGGGGEHNTSEGLFYLQHMNFDPKLYTENEIAFLRLVQAGATYVSPENKIIPVVSFEFFSYVCTLYRDQYRITTYFHGKSTVDPPTFDRDRFSSFALPGNTGAFMVDGLMFERTLATLDDQMREYEKIPLSIIRYSYQHLVSQACLLRNPLLYIAQEGIHSPADLDYEKAKRLVLLCHVDSPYFKKLLSDWKRSMGRGASLENLITDNMVIPIPYVVVNYLCGHHAQFGEYQASLQLPEETVVPLVPVLTSRIGISTATAAAGGAEVKSRKHPVSHRASFVRKETEFFSDAEYAQNNEMSSELFTLFCGSRGDQTWMLVSAIAPYVHYTKWQTGDESEVDDELSL